MAQQGSYSVVVKAVDAASGTLAKINRSMIPINRSVDKLNLRLTQFGKLSGLSKLSNSFGAVNKQVVSVAKSTLALAGGLGAVSGALSIAGLASIIGQTTQYNSALRNNATLAGISAAELEKLQLANRLVGVSAETTTSNLRSIGVSMHEAMMNPASESAQAFRALNIDIVKSGYVSMTSASRLGVLADAYQSLLADVKSGKRDMPSVVQEMNALGVSEDMLPALEHGSKGLAENEAATAGERSSNPGSSPLQRQLAANAMHFEKLSHSIGESLAPAVSQLLQTLDPLISKFDAWITDAKNIKVVNEGIGTAIQFINTTITDTIPNIVKFIDENGGMANALKLFGAAVLLDAVAPLAALSIALLTTPAGWVITALAGISIALYELWKNWTDVKKWWSETWNDLCKSLSFKHLKEMWDREWKEIYTFVVSVFDSVSRFCVETFETVTKALTFKHIKEMWAKEFAEIFKAFKPMIEPITEWFKKEWKIASDFFLGLWDPILAKIKAITDPIKTVFEALESFLPAEIKVKLGLQPSSGPDIAPDAGPDDGTDDGSKGWQQRDIELLKTKYKLSPEDAIGIVSNFEAESDGKAKYNDGNNVGLASWSRKDSPDRFEDFKRRYGHGLEQSTRAEQIDFFVSEASRKGVLGRSSSGAEAADIISRRVEIPKDADGAARHRREIAARLGGAPKGLPIVSPPAAPQASNSIVAPIGHQQLAQNQIQPIGHQQLAQNQIQPIIPQQYQIAQQQQNLNSNSTVHVIVDFNNVPKNVKTNASANGNSRVAMTRTQGAIVG